MFISTNCFRFRSVEFQCKKYNIILIDFDQLYVLFWMYLSNMWIVLPYLLTSVLVFGFCVVCVLCWLRYFNNKTKTVTKTFLSGGDFCDFETNWTHTTLFRSQVFRIFGLFSAVYRIGTSTAFRSLSDLKCFLNFATNCVCMTVFSLFWTARTPLSILKH